MIMNMIDKNNNPEKGKPSERMGRKATGLRPCIKDKVAGLPGLVSGLYVREAFQEVVK